EDLGECASGVVRDEVSRREVERVTELLDDRGETAEREVLVGSRRAGTVQRKIEGHASPRRHELLDHPAPQIRVRANAVNEQRRRPFTDVDVADVGVARRDPRAVTLEVFRAHAIASPDGMLSADRLPSTSRVHRPRTTTYSQ